MFGDNLFNESLIENGSRTKDGDNVLTSQKHVCGSVHYPSFLCVRLTQVTMTPKLKFYVRVKEAN